MIYLTIDEKQKMEDAVIDAMITPRVKAGNSLREMLNQKNM